MRERWVDHGGGCFRLDTDTVHLWLYSRASKNYRTIHSKWTLVCFIKGQYGRACTFHNEFGGTFDEAFERVETILLEVKEALSEIM